MKPAGKLSVIIPVLWDADDLRLLLARLAQLSEPPDEIICVDGDADPETRQACLQAGARYLQSETGRGMQLDTGARAATGNWLWFLHADASPPMNGAIAVRQALGRGAVGGWFRFRFAQTDHVLARSLARFAKGGFECETILPFDVDPLGREPIAIAALNRS